MSTIKRLINIVTILLCIIGLYFYFSIDSALAADDCELILSSTQGKKGDEVTIKMTLQSNSGLAGLQYTIKYDTSALSLVSAKGIEGTFSAPVVNTQNEGAIVYVFAEARSNTRTGDLMEATFKILDGANSNNVALKLDSVMGVDNDVNIVNVKTTIGDIKLIETGNGGESNNNTNVEDNPTSSNPTNGDNSTLDNNSTMDNKEDNNKGNSNNTNNVNNSLNNTKTDKDGNVISDNVNDKNDSGNKSNKSIIIIIIIVIIAILAVSGYIIYNKKYKKNNDDSNNNS